MKDRAGIGTLSFMKIRVLSQDELTEDELTEDELTEDELTEAEAPAVRAGVPAQGGWDRRGAPDRTGVQRAAGGAGTLDATPAG
jgi:hypothetical protein